MRAAPPTLAIYTFPRRESDGLKIKVSFNDKNGNTLYEDDYQDVPVKVGMRTCYKCNLPNDFVDALSKDGHIKEKWGKGFLKSYKQQEKNQQNVFSSMRAKILARQDKA